MGLLYQSTPQTQYDYGELTTIATTSGNRCFLVGLSDLQILLLLAALKSAEFGVTRWANGTKDAIDALVAETEYCLMSGCNVADLVSTQRMIVAALIGQNVDLTTELPTIVDFTSTGIGPRLDALTAKIEEIRALVEAGNTETDDIEEILDAINIVLGGTGILP